MWREAGNAVDGLGLEVALSLDCPLETKDLLHPRPGACQELVQLGTGDQFADLQTPMAFGAGACLPPIAHIRWWLRKKS